jgi:heme exporter protein CcmD
MSHLPFIWAAYGSGAVILAWCALAPLARGRKIRRQIASMHQHAETRNAPRP